MSDSFRETTSISWGGRIKRSAGATIFGLALVALMVAGLFWNEGRALQTARSLADGAGMVISTGIDNVDAANNGKLVHMVGPVTVTGILVDPEFGIATDGLRLKRIVEMYQWKEEQTSEAKKKLGGGEETVTTYSYSKAWEKQPIDSSKFKIPDGHQNPSKDIDSKTFQMDDGRLGAFTLDKTILDRIGGGVAYSMPPGQLSAVMAAYRGNRRVHAVENQIYLGYNPKSPLPGDYRIGYEVAPLGAISIVARQVGDRFEPYQSTHGDPLLMVATGEVPATKMFADATTGNTLVTWLFRGAGMLLLGVGFGLLLGPIGAILDVVPVVGSVARLGTAIVAASLAILTGTLTISIAWFWYRPLLAGGILLASLVAVAVIFHLGQRHKMRSDR